VTTIDAEGSTAQMIEGRTKEKMTRRRPTRKTTDEEHDRRG